MKKPRLLGVVFTLFSVSLISPTIGLASLLNYDETIDGDLTGFTRSILYLDNGVNVISGSAEFSINATDSDAFSIVIPSGSQLVSVNYSFDNINKSGSTLTSSYFLRDQSDTFISSGTANISPGISPVSFFSSALPLASDSYRMGHSMSYSGSGGSWDYVFTFEVTPVPLPATLWLFGSGLLGLIGISRRKQAA